MKTQMGNYYGPGYSVGVQSKFLYNEDGDSVGIHRVEAQVYGHSTISSGTLPPRISLSIHGGMATSVNIDLHDMDGTLCDVLRDLAEHVEAEWIAYLDHLHAIALKQDEYRNVNKECRAIA